MSDLPPEDRQRLIRATFTELFRENAKDPQFIQELRAIFKQLDKDEAEQQPPQPPQPPTRPQQQHSSNRVSAFDKFLLGR